MRIRYVIRLKEPIELEDHWPIPFMGGQLRVISDGKTATGLEIAVSGQPTDYAPRIEHNPSRRVPTTISGRDHLFPFVRQRLKSAFSYLQCYFDIEISDEFEIFFEPENESEKSHIHISNISRGKENRLLPLTFDYITRAVMTAEKLSGPNFESTLVSAAREAARLERFIDSFRYSFLLIESLYGDGKSKNHDLKSALKKNQSFADMVATALKERIPLKKPKASVTEKLLSSSPHVHDVIDHLVEMRGFYFHGNVKRKDAWTPHNQDKAEALCMLSLDIAMFISHAAAAPMFADELSQRHFNDAEQVGAIVTMKIDFTFREPNDTFDRKGALTFRLPGTTVTSKMPQYVAQQFLTQFEHDAPVAALKSASCSVEKTGQKVFDIRFFPPE